MYVGQCNFARMYGKVLKNIFVAICLCLSALCVQAQEIHIAEAIRAVFGETDVESLDQDVVESMNELIRHPLRLNSAGVSELEATGLFTPFQISALTDYIKRHGSVLSLAELSALDGFSPERAEEMAPFICLDPSLSKGAGRIFTGDFSIRGGYKHDVVRQVSKSTYGVRSRLMWSDKVSVGFSATEPYDSAKAWPTLYTGNISWQHRFGKVVAGDFNARFGQGLCLWNTASFSSLTSPSSFMKRPGGISSSYSFTGTSALTGLAADFVVGRWKAAAMVTVPGIKKYLSKPQSLLVTPAVNLTRYGRYGHLGMTHKMSFSNILSSEYRIPEMLSAVDGSFCIQGVCIFAEALFDWVSTQPAVLAGGEFAAGEVVTMASQVRYVPKVNEHAAALSAEATSAKHKVTVSAEGKYHPVSKSREGRDSYQIKSQADWQWIPRQWLTVRLRLSERFRTWGNAFKTQLRSEMRFTGDCWSATLRMDALYGLDFAGSAYVEGGYSPGRLSLYARVGMFMVDNWDDRIYVYERDAPGNFNVPALYGRGFWTSCYLSWKYARWGTLCLRGTYKNPGNAEVKLQCMLHF